MISFPLTSAIGRLRAIGMLEGTSFLILLGVAMPMKYLGDKPQAVSIVGLIHGILFLLFCLALLHVKLDHGWTIRKSLKPFIAALVPFGPFIIDRSLQAEQQQHQAPER